MQENRNMFFETERRKSSFQKLTNSHWKHSMTNEIESEQWYHILDLYGFFFWMKLKNKKTYKHNYVFKFTNGVGEIFTFRLNLSRASHRYILRHYYLNFFWYTLLLGIFWLFGGNSFSRRFRKNNHWIALLKTFLMVKCCCSSSICRFLNLYMFRQPW